MKNLRSKVSKNLLADLINSCISSSKKTPAPVVAPVKLSSKASIEKTIK